MGFITLLVCEEVLTLAAVIYQIPYVVYLPIRAAMFTILFVAFMFSMIAREHYKTKVESISHQDLEQIKEKLASIEEYSPLILQQIEKLDIKISKLNEKK